MRFGRMTVSIVRLLRRGGLVAPLVLGGRGMVRLSGGFVVFSGFGMSRFRHGISPSCAPHSLRPTKHGLVLSLYNSHSYLNKFKCYINDCEICFLALLSYNGLIVNYIINILNCIMGRFLGDDDRQNKHPDD